jgi:ParB/RepB/Spo0J family partition protein
MKAQFLQASGIDNEQDFLSKYPTQEAFFKEFPNMQELAKAPIDNEINTGSDGAVITSEKIDPNKKPSLSKLSKQNTAKLNGIINQMIDNNESDDDINFIVKEFKNKYSEKKKEVSVSTVPKEKLASGVPENGSLVGKKSNVNVPVTKPDSEKTGKNKIINIPKPAKKEYDFVDSLLDNLDTGLATVAKSIYDAPALVYDTFASVTNIIPKILGAEGASSEKFAETFGLRNVPAEVLKEKIDRTNKSIQTYNDKNGGDAFEAASNGNYLGAAKMIAGTTMQSLPLMVAAMATGGSSASLLAIGTSTASTKAAELKESNPEMDVATRTVNAAVSGVIEATMGHLLNGASGAVVKKIIADKGAEAGSKLISKSFRAVIEKTIEKNPVIAGFGEILEESLVEGGNQINDMASGIRTEFDFKAIANAGLSATGMGIGNTVAIYGAKGFVNANDYKKAKTINKEITKLSTELSNENLSDSDKQLLSTRIDRLVTGNKKLIGDGMDKITALPVPVKQELVSINSSLDELKSKILDIQDNYDISEDTKNALIDEIKQQGQELSIRKQKVIEGGYIYDDFDKLPQEAKNRLKDEAGRILLEEAKKEGKTSASFDDAQLSKKAAELRNEELKAVFEIDNMENTTTQTSAPTSGEVAAPSVNPLDNSTVVEQTTLTAIEPIKSIKESVEDNGIYYYDGEKGALSIDGQQVVFETKDKIIELGNIDDLSQNDIKDLGLEQESEINISLNDDMSIEVNGIQYLNNYSNPESAISQDKDGNYTVSLDTKNGQKRNFRGQQADQIVYQYKLKNLEENATEQQIESASQLADEAIRVEEEIRESSPKRKAKSVRKSKQRTLKTVKEPLNNKEKQQQVTNEIEILRADEQAELREVIPDAEQFVTDGKIDKTKLENTKDKQKFDEIYDRYDKLITPLLEQQNEATPPTDTPANGNIKPGTPIVEQDGKQQGNPAEKVPEAVVVGESKGDVKVDVVGKKIGGKKTKGISASVTDLFIKEIQTDESRFQNREGLDEERVQNIVKNFDENKLDPITVFEESGKYTVLSGHHRFEAMKRMGVNKIAVKIFEGTEAEAKEFAKDSNTLGKQETVIERAKRYRELREQGMSEKQISDMARQAHGSDAVKIVNMSRLDSSGKAIKTVKQFENSSDTDTKNKVQAVADWIGQVKSKHSDLSRVQENEMFDYLMDSYSTKKGSGKITNKMQFFDLADALVKRLKEKGNFDQDSVLNFKNSLGKSSIELEYDKILQDAKDAVKLAQKELDDKRSSLLLNGAKKEDFDRVLPVYEDKLQNAIKNENDIRKDKGLLKDAVRDQVSLFDEIQNEILDEKPNVQREVQDVFEGNKGKTPEGERGAKEVQAEPNKAEQGVAAKILNQDNVKGVLDFLDDLKFDNNNLYSTIPFAPQVWNAFIEAVKLSVKAGNSIKKAIQEGINTLRNQGLNQTEVDDVVTYFNEKLNKNATGHAEIFTDIENAISQGKTKEEILDAYNDSKEKRQAENIYNRIVSKNISEEDAYDEVKAAFDKARTELENKKPTKELIRSAYRRFVKRFTDRQYLAKRLLDKSGFKNVKNLIINAHGASGKAKMQFQEAYDKIYKGLSRAERNSLDEIIQAKRFIAIDEARELQGKGPVTHPNFIDKNKSEKFLSQLEKEMGTKKYTDLTKRAEAYFATYKNLLTQMKENGLITQEAFDAMEADYQPRVFLQYVTDFEGNIEAGKQSNQVDTGGLSSDQIKSLSDGDANSLVLNSEYLLTNSLLARSKAMAINNVNKRFMTGDFQEAKKRFEKLDPRNLKGDDVRFYKYFKELNTKVIDNPIIGFTDSGNAKYQYDKTPANFQKAYYFVDGQRNEFFMEKELHESWFDNMNHILSSGAKEFISYASGSALLKGIATGNNPAFPIVNTPRDFLFTVAFSDQYSKIVPKAMLQVGKDVVKAIAEIRKPQSDVLQKYMEYGGAMDFLSSQGKLKKSSVIGKAIDKAVSPNARDISKAVFDKLTLHKIAQYSEIMFRLGIFERSIQNQLKGLGLNDVSQVTDKQQLDDIYNEAVSSARSILDFNQGGTVTKDLEAVIPYINVAFQGGRVAATAFEKDPAGTTSRILQVATLASAVPIGISLALISGMKGDDDEDKSAYEIYLHALDGISPYQKMRYMNIVTPVKDEEGEYMVLKIAKAQELSPFMSLTDDIYNNFIRGLAGKEKKSAGAITKSVLSTFNDNVMPIDFSSPAGLVTRNPVVKATLTYATGYDFFRDQPLSNDIGKVPLPVEGITMKSTEEFYKKIGDNFGLSPVRSKAFVESLITSPSTNPFVGMLYGGADAAVSDKDIKIIGKDLFQTIYKSTGKRVVSYSSDFMRQLAGKVELQEEIDAINIKQYKEKAEFNKVAKQFEKKEISKEDLRSKISEAEPLDRKRIANKVKDKIRFKDIDATIIDIKYEQGAKVKALLIANYYGDILDKSEDSKKILRQMAQVQGILTPEVIVEYKKLKEELKTKTPN